MTKTKQKTQKIPRRSIVYLFIGVLLLTLSPFISHATYGYLSKDCQPTIDSFGKCPFERGFAYSLESTVVTSAAIVVGVGLILTVLIPLLINLYRQYTKNKRSLVARKVNNVIWLTVFIGTFVWSFVDPRFQSHIYGSFFLSHLFAFIPLLVTSFIIGWAYSISVIKSNQWAIVKATVVSGIVISVLSYFAYILIILADSFFKI